jgi:hypothetical protein
VLFRPSRINVSDLLLVFIKISPTATTSNRWLALVSLHQARNCARFTLASLRAEKGSHRKESSPRISTVFGEVLDYARSLSADEVPGYLEWQRKIKESKLLEADLTTAQTSTAYQKCVQFSISLNLTLQWRVDTPVRTPPPVQVAS